MGFTYYEAYNIPIWQRVWFIKRISKEIEKANGASKAAHSNSEDVRAMQGMHRANPPAKLRRFT